MKTQPHKKRDSFAARLVANRLARMADCPTYDGAGAIEPSDSPDVVVKAPGRNAALVVSRETVEGGIPDDIEDRWEDEQML